MNSENLTDKQKKWYIKAKHELAHLKKENFILKKENKRLKDEVKVMSNSLIFMCSMT